MVPMIKNEVVSKVNGFIDTNCFFRNMQIASHKEEIRPNLQGHQLSRGSKPRLIVKPSVRRSSSVFERVK